MTEDCPQQNRISKKGWCGNGLLSPNVTYLDLVSHRNSLNLSLQNRALPNWDSINSVLLWPLNFKLCPAEVVFSRFSFFFGMIHQYCPCIGPTHRLLSCTHNLWVLSSQALKALTNILVFSCTWRKDVHQSGWPKVSRKQLCGGMEIPCRLVFT